MPTITLPEFLNLKPSITEYNERDIREATTLAQEINAFYPAQPMITYSEYDRGIHFEYVYVHLVHPTLELWVRQDRGKYHIYCKNLDNFRQIIYNGSDHIKEGLHEPVTIGVFSSKKILAWVNYYEELYRRVKTVNDENQGKAEAFRKSLEGLPVKWWDENKKGEIKRGGLNFSFEIHETFISTKIAVHYETNADLFTFLKLADNKYISPKIKSGV